MLFLHADNLALPPTGKVIIGDEWLKSTLIFIILAIFSLFSNFSSSFKQKQISTVWQI